MFEIRAQFAIEIPLAGMHANGEKKSLAPGQRIDLFHPIACEPHRGPVVITKRRRVQDPGAAALDAFDVFDDLRLPPVPLGGRQEHICSRYARDADLLSVEEKASCHHRALQLRGDGEGVKHLVASREARQVPGILRLRGVEIAHGFDRNAVPDVDQPHAGEPSVDA